MGTTSIQWTDRVWNPMRGCSFVNADCQNCYAAGITARFSGKGEQFEGLAKFSSKRKLPQFTGKTRFGAEKLAEPLRWRKPSRVFVNSMSDVFHEGFTNEQIAAVFGVMAATPWHIYQLLTKRPERAREWFEWIANETFQQHASGDQDEFVQRAAYAELRALGLKKLFPLHKVKGTLKQFPWPLPNVHLGVSVENQATAAERIHVLLSTPAAVRFISAEPLLEAIDLTRVGTPGVAGRIPLDALTGITGGDWRFPGLDWVIVGGESGRRARPFDLVWARNIVADCKRAGVPVFVKQLGASPFDTDMVTGEEPFGCVGVSLTDPAGGDPAEWPEGLRVRQFPRAH